MAEKREFELLVLDLTPGVVRNDRMTVGVVVLEPGGQFADVRFTRDWKRVACFAPDIELEFFEHCESVVRERLKEIRGRDDLVQLLDERFGMVFDVGAVKGLLAADPAAEMRVLERDYLEPWRAGPDPHERRMGRLRIVGEMEAAFADAGVLELLQRDLDMTEFTGESDPFRVDFGFRVGQSVKMFQALALNVSREPAVTLAYRYSRIQAGIRVRGEEALMTAIINDEVMRTRGQVASGVAVLKANEIAVRGLEEMGEIAAEVKREIGA